MPKKHPDDHYFDEYDARAYRHLVHREEHAGNGQNQKKEKKRKQKKQKSHKKSREKQESNQEVKNVNKEFILINRKRKHFNIKTKKNVITLINNKQITNRSLCQI